MTEVVEKNYIYLEYVELFEKRKQAEKDYNSAIDSKQRLLYNVTPHSIIPTEVVNHLSSSGTDSKFINYSAEIDEVEERIKISRDIFDNRTYLLKIKEADLRNSKEPYDKIYVCYWLDNQKVKHFYRYVGYTREYVYEVIDKMRNQINDIRTKVKNDEKN